MDMNEFETLLEESGMSVTKIIGKAKSDWKRTKEQRVYSDEISKEEAKLFIDDKELVKRYLDMLKAKKAVNEYIDTKLGGHRKEIRELIMGE